MWKIIFVECRPVGGQQGSIGTLTQLPRNARCDFFSNTCQKMQGGKHVKVKNGGIRIFCVFALMREN